MYLVINQSITVHLIFIYISRKCQHHGRCRGKVRVSWMSVQKFVPNRLTVVGWYFCVDRSCETTNQPIATPRAMLLTCLKKPRSPNWTLHFSTVFRHFVLGNKGQLRLSPLRTCYDFLLGTDWAPLIHLQDTWQDTVMVLLQVHKAHVDCLVELLGPVLSMYSILILVY